MARFSDRPISARDTIATCVSSIIVIGLVMLTINGSQIWRVHHFKHVIATIDAVWNEEIHPSKNRTIVTKARISFTRPGSDGRSVYCNETEIIGVPQDDYGAGEKLEIVPATGSCYRPYIIGRPSPPAVGY